MGAGRRCGGAVGDRGGVPRRGHQTHRLRHHRLGDPDPGSARNAVADRTIRREGVAQRRDLVPAVLRARRRFGRGVDQDQGHPGGRRLEDQRAEGVDQRGALLRARSGHRAHRPGGAQARRHHHGDRGHERSRGRGASAASDHRWVGLQRGVFQRPVRARRRRGRGAQHRLDGRAGHAGQRAGQHRWQRILLRGFGHATSGADQGSAGSVGGRANSGGPIPGRGECAAAAEPAPRRAQRRGSGPGSGRQRHQAETVRPHDRGRRDHGRAGGARGRTARR